VDSVLWREFEERSAFETVCRVKAVVGLAGLVREGKTERSLPRIVARRLSRSRTVVDGSFPLDSSVVRRRRFSEGKIGKGRGIESRWKCTAATESR
jgi:hypothetical protein